MAKGEAGPAYYTGDGGRGVKTGGKAPRVAVVQPRLDGHGGLEKYGVHLIRVLSELLPVEVISEHPVDPAVIERAFNVRLDRPRLVCDADCSPVLPQEANLQSRLRRRNALRRYQRLTGRYDLVIGQTVGLPLRSGARRSALLCHFPVVRGQRIDASVAHQGWRSWLSSQGREQRDIRNRLKSWTRIIGNSAFTGRYVKAYWDREVTLINPPIELPSAPDLREKKQWILAAGFFCKPNGGPGDPWSYKRHEVLIDTFRELCDGGLKGWELHLAGHVLPPTPDVFEYVEGLRRRAQGYPIHLHPNCPHPELMSLYRGASILWHATGYGLDEHEHPERMEHFGMVTAEAMGWGCVPIVINKGGQPEIVEHGRSGLLWDDLRQLRDWTLLQIANPQARLTMAEAAVARAQVFGMGRFERQVGRFLEEELSQLSGAH